MYKNNKKVVNKIVTYITNHPVITLSITIVLPFVFIHVGTILINLFHFTKSNWVTLILNFDDGISVSDYLGLYMSLLSVIVTVLFSFAVLDTSKTANQIAELAFNENQKPADIHFSISEKCVLVLEKKEDNPCYLFHFPISIYNRSGNIGTVTRIEFQVNQKEKSHKNDIYLWDSFCKDSIKGWKLRSTIRPIPVSAAKPYTDIVTFLPRTKNINFLDGGTYEIEVVLYYEYMNDSDLKIDTSKMNYTFDVDMHSIVKVYSNIVNSRNENIFFSLKSNIS